MSDFIPLPKQFVAMTCPARKTMYAGAAGPGKSELMINMSKYRALAVDNSVHVYFRRVSKDLNQHVRKARRYIPSTRGDEHAIARETGDKTERRFIFDNKAEFVFTHLQQDSHVAGHEGAEYDTINFDEAGRFNPYMLSFLPSRLRTTELDTYSVGGPREMYSSNPQGVGFDFLRKMFIYIDPSDVKEVIAYYPIEEAEAVWEEVKEGLQVDYLHPDDIQEACKRWIKMVRERGIDWRLYDDETRVTKKDVEPFDVWTAYPNEIMREYGIEETHTRCFIPAYLEDNPYLGPDYVVQLAELHGDLAERLLKGDWSVFEGQFFKDWAERKLDAETHEEIDWHVIPPVSIPDWWPKVAAMDYGYSKESMLVIGFFAYNPENDEWIMWDEIAVNQMVDPDVIRRFKSVASGHVIDLVACDPAMFGTKNYENGKSQGDYYKDSGVPLVPADNKRIPGWGVLRSLLSVNPRTGRPRLRICSNCTYTRKTLPGLVHDEKNHEDLDDDGEDHCLHGGTLVETVNGPIPIRDLVGHEGYVYGPDGLVYPFRSVRLTHANEPVMRLALTDGRSVTATPDHRFLRPDGSWAYLSDLHVGDQIVDIAEIMRYNQSHESENHQFNNSGIRWPALLPVRPVFSAFQKRWRETPAQDSLVASSRLHPRWMPRSPQRRRPLKQSDRKSGTFAGVRAFVTSYTGRGVQGAFASGLAEARYSQGSRMASVGRGAAVALGHAQGDMAGSQTAQEILHRLWHGIRDAVSKALQVLPSELQADGPAPPTSRIACIEHAGRADTYTMTVPGPYSYAVEGGIIVKNSADMLRYFAVRASNQGYGHYREESEPVGVGSWDSSRIYGENEIEPAFLFEGEGDPWG